MSGWNRRFLLRSLYVFSVGLCSLHLLAQSPTSEKSPQPEPANEITQKQAHRPRACEHERDRPDPHRIDPGHHSHQQHGSPHLG